MDSVDFLTGLDEDIKANDLPRTNIGKLTITAEFWKKGDKDAGIKGSQVTQDEYMNLPANQRFRKLVFYVDIREFAPSLSYDYTPKGILIGSPDWREILCPSVETAYGAGSMSNTEAINTLRKLTGQYVECENAPQTKGDINPQTGKPYTTFKLVKVFASREEAYAEHTRRFPPEKNENSNGNGHEGETSKTKSEQKANGGLRTWEPATWKQQWPDMLKSYLDTSAPQSVGDLAKMYEEDSAQVEAALVTQYWNEHAGDNSVKIAQALKMPVVKVNGIMQNGVHPAF